MFNPGSKTFKERERQASEAILLIEERSTLILAYKLAVKVPSFFVAAEDDEEATEAEVVMEADAAERSLEELLAEEEEEERKERERRKWQLHLLLGIASQRSLNLRPRISISKITTAPSTRQVATAVQTLQRTLRIKRVV